MRSVLLAQDRRRAAAGVVVALLWGFVFAPASPAQTSSAGPLWQALPRSESPILVRPPLVVFTEEGGAGRIMNLSEFETAFLSPRGDRCVVFDREKRRAQVFDAQGVALAAFGTEQSFAGVVVSNSGLIATYDAIVMHPETDYIELHDAEGALLWRTPERFRRSLLMEFSPDGELLAVMIPTAAGDGLEAVLYNRKGQLWSRNLGPGLDSGDILFDHGGSRIAFVANRTEPAAQRAVEVHLWEGGRSTWRALRLPGASYPVTSENLAFTPDDSRILLNGMGRVQAYSTASGASVWIADLNGPTRTRDLLDSAVRLDVIDDRVIAAHRISVPEGRMKYAITFLDLGGSVVGKEVQTEPQARLADPGRFWDIVDHGRHLRLQVGPSPVQVAIP